MRRLVISTALLLAMMFLRAGLAQQSPWPKRNTM